MHVLTTALRLAEPRVAAALQVRFRSELEALLAECTGIPRHILGRLLDEDAFDLTGYLNETGKDGKHATELNLAAARLGDPETAAYLFRSRARVDPAVLDEVFARITRPEDGVWYAQNGLAWAIRREAGADPLFVLRLPFDLLVQQVAADRCKEVPYAVAVDLCVAVAERRGRDALRELAAADLGHPGLAALLVQAAEAPAPAHFLADARPPLDWADAAQVRTFLRVRMAGGWSDEYAETPLDWDLVRAEHARLPLSGESLSWLMKWPDCPDDIQVAAIEAYPYYAMRMARRLPFEMLGHEVFERWPDQFAMLMRRGIQEGWISAARVLAEAAPAGRVLAALPYDEQPVRDALADVFAPLGTDPTAWLTLYAKMPRFEGSAAELAAAVAATAKRTKTWPRPLPAVFPATEPENTRATFLGIIGAVADGVTIALAPYFDARSVQHILVYGHRSPEVRDALAAAHGTPALASYAACGTLDPEEVEWLLGLDEPAVDAMLFAHARISDAERTRLLFGIRRNGTRDRVPPELLAVLEELNLGHYRARLTAGMTGGDPGVADVIVRRLRLGTEGGRLRLVAAVWERYGADEARAVVQPGRMPVATVKLLTRFLDADDQAAALGELRARVAVEDSPDKVVAYLAKKASDADDHLRRLLQEGAELPWPQLVEAVQADRLSAQMLANLIEQKDSPREFVIAGLHAQAKLDKQRQPRYRDWREHVLRRGVISPADLLELSVRPSGVLATVARDRRFTGQFTREEPCAEGRALVAEYLGDDVEAWTVAIRLADDFSGTTRELLATAKAMAQ
ncbi:hypothetical protein [Yinghuangia soli]|uniref:Uncharacterized protein n=1 Tax=Yinghuangia soli TaxID=2908204 RepID=A0AA41PZQ6_9ACTN|nr:hypothetical protein [Yinghuangia soli]MCF2528111.1 hypothetical protein [Yinghuangia soli]